MKHPIGTRVKVLPSPDNDETMTVERIGHVGVIHRHNANNQTGNTEEDPLHCVRFDTLVDGKDNEEFWYEELAPVVYSTEDTEPFGSTSYTYNEVLALAGGDAAYADSLITRAEWQHIETLIAEDEMCK